MSTIREAPFFGWCVPQKCVQHPQPTLHQLLFVSTFSSSAISSTKKSQAYHGHSHCILCMAIKPLTITKRWSEIKPASQGGWELLSPPSWLPEKDTQLTEAEASKPCLAAKQPPTQKLRLQRHPLMLLGQTKNFRDGRLHAVLSASAEKTALLELAEQSYRQVMA